MTLAADYLARQLNSYIAYLKRSKHGVDVPPADSAVRETPELYALDAPDDDL